MTAVPRRTIEELVLLHKLEIEIKDIYVEGDYDRCLLAWFLSTIGCREVEIRTIQSIEVDDGKLLGVGNKANNRERVIQLAREFSRLYPQDGKILCIADRDFGEYIDEDVAIRDLVLTDFTCMEMYLWKDSVIYKFLCIYGKKPEFLAENVMVSIRGPLTDIFSLRVAAEWSKMNLAWFRRPVCVSLTEEHLVLDKQEYAKRLLSKAGELDKLSEFLQLAERFLERIGADQRFYTHGHDFIEYLSCYLKKKGLDHKFSDSEVIARSLPLCHELEDISEYGVFQRISKFCSTTVRKVSEERNCSG